MGIPLDQVIRDFAAVDRIAAAAIDGAHAEMLATLDGLGLPREQRDVALCGLAASFSDVRDEMQRYLAEHLGLLLLRTVSTGDASADQPTDQSVESEEATN